MIYDIDSLKDLYRAIKMLAKYYLPNECDDLTQEIAISLWSKRKRLPANFNSSYLKVVVRNAAYSMIRKDRKRKMLCCFSINENGSISIVGEATNEMYLSHTNADSPETQNQLANTLAAVERLPAEQRSAIELAASGFNYSEIAAQQGVAVGTVRSRLHYARKKIEELTHGMR